MRGNKLEDTVGNRDRLLLIQKTGEDSSATPFFTPFSFAPLVQRQIL
jgi:hypothetical protein